MTSNKKSKGKKKSAAKKKGSTKKSSKKKTGTKKAAKKTSTKKAGAKKAGTKKTSSHKTASGNMPPVELFEEPTAQATKQMAGTSVAEPWYESEQESTSSLPDLMARTITENLDARPAAPSETLDTSATTAGSPTWRAFQASTRNQKNSLVGRHLTAVWNFLVALLGAPPPANKAG